MAWLGVTAATRRELADYRIWFRDTKPQVEAEILRYRTVIYNEVRKIERTKDKPASERKELGRRASDVSTRPTIVIDGFFMQGLGRAGAVWSKADDRNSVMTLQGQFLAERLWSHEAAHRQAGPTLSEQQWEERRVMDVEKRVHGGTLKVYGEESIESHRCK